MPPRLQTQSLQQQVTRCASSRLPAAERALSVTPSCHAQTKLRINMFRALDKIEQDSVKRRGPVYVGTGDRQPFPENSLFQSQPVLDENARETIWRRVVQEGVAMKVVSADMGVDIRRVAAVVRLKQMEKRWAMEGKWLAKPYSKAILDMLPKTTYKPGENVTHEPINDVHVHSYTMQQIFMPTSESQQFTRYDAARAFHKNMLPPDERTVHKELIEMQKQNLQGADKRETALMFEEKAKATEAGWAKKTAHLAAMEEARIKKVRTDRFEFRFRDFNSEDVGRNGRKRDVVGWRYGAPLDDRKRGKVKIPTQVP